jgi:folate-binding protein YgfZ
VVDLTGLGGAALVVPRSEEAAVRQIAVAEGAVPASDEDWVRLRVERLVPAYGIDMDDQRSPHDVSLERRVVSWSKGCYLGQEAVCMQDMRGKVKRRLAVLRLQGGGVPAPGSKVSDESSTEVGETRSAAKSAVFGAPVALAFLTAASAVPGTKLVVEGQRAEVVEPR